MWSTNSRVHAGQLYSYEFRSIEERRCSALTSFLVVFACSGQPGLSGRAVVLDQKEVSDEKK